MTVTTAAAGTDPYADAWTDLKTRLTRGAATLDDLIDNTPADEAARVDRLTRKAAGLRLAAHTRDTLDGLPAGTPPAHAWREYTAWVARLAGDLPAGSPVRAGLLLGLDYQRGYSPEIDAPSHRNLGLA